MTLVAGVDSSTQSCKVEIRDADSGALVGRGAAPHPPTAPPVSEQPPAAWWDAFVAAFDAACARLDRGRVAAISVAAQCHGLIAMDADGAVLRPAKLWNDTTSAPQADAMVAELGADGWVERVGSTPTAAFTITKLAWLAEHEPGALARIATVLLPHDWMTWRLTGRRVTDRSDASGTGYFAAHEMRWCVDLLERFVSTEVDWDHALPQVLGPSQPAGPLAAAAASALGLDSDVVVGPGGGDQHVGALGLGLAPGEVCYSLGTSGVVFSPCDHPVHDRAGWVDGVADAAGGYLPLICTLNAAKVTDAFARLLGVDHEGLSALALAAPADPDRPLMAAFLDGERSPALPAARGLLGGLTTTTSRAALARAAFEGVLLGLTRGHDALRAAGIAADGEVVVTGGGARSPAYRQLLADLLGRPVVTRDADGFTARGACVQAAAVARGVDVTQVRSEWTPRRTSTTDPRGAGADTSVRERYLRLAEAAASTSPRA